MNTLKKQKLQEVNIVALKQFLTFRIGNEHFGLELSKTREIIEFNGITSVPLMPDFMRGVINLRGEVVPVIDLAVRLARAPIDVQKRSCIIVVELRSNEQNHVLGLLVDSVSEVIELDEENIEDAPSFGANIRADFIQGVAKLNNDFVILLDADQAMSVRELAHLVEAQMQ
jgi:purine-binding chemotaxis protein CheW